MSTLILRCNSCKEPAAATLKGGLCEVCDSTQNKTPLRCELIFDRVADARKVNRRLRDFNVLSRVVQGRRGQKPELHIEVRPSRTPQQERDLALAIHRGEHDGWEA